MIGTPLQRCISKRRVLSSPLTEVSTTPIISERDALKRLTALDKSVGRHDKLYYELSAPELSDAAYDELIAEATRIERAFPKLHGTVKKLRGVGFQPSDVFEQFPHIGPMLSLSNMFTLEDVTKFVARIQSKVAQGVDFPPPQFVIEPKIDGISLSLLYRAGTLSRAGTRGDGQTGEDVTPNVLLYVDDIPRVLSHPIAVENHIIEVRGEVYMSKQKLLDHNIREEVRDFSTARNAASGILRRKSARDILRDLGSPLNFFAYALYIHDSGDPTRVHTTQPAKTQAGVLANLLDLGFRVASLKDPMVTRWPALSSESTELHESSEDIYNSFINYENRRHLIPYDIDGAVVKLNDICSQSFLGCATRYPRWAAAIKFKSEQRVTKLRGITVQVGSKGALTPVAVLDAVMLGGVTVTRATLHNEDNVNRILGNELSGYTQFESDLNINVVVCRSGDVIPKVLGTVSNATVQHAVDSAKASSGIYRLPRHCPSCGSASERLGDDAAVTCSADQLTCPAQNLGAIR